MGICTAVITVSKGIDTDYSKIIGELRKQKRSKISVKEKRKEITISIEANDITALRASMNNLIKDIQVIEGIKIEAQG